CTAHSYCFTLTSSCVRSSTLAIYRKSAFVAKATVSVNILKTLNIISYLTLQVAFNGIIGIDYFAKSLFFSLGEIFHPSGRLYFSRRKDGRCKFWTDAVNIRQSDLNLLF